MQMVDDLTTGQRDLGNKFQWNWELASGPGDDADRKMNLDEGAS
ncbi:hypothetical protein [Fontibacillus phaseoli]|nr:hypothetical protein [Fontibacillus phaseoli]